MSASPLFPASVIGSMPRSAFVKDLIAADCPLSVEEYDRAMDAAVRYIVALQEHAGLDVVTDGEWRRKSYIGVIAELADGFELSRNPADGRPWTVVVDRLTASQPGFIAREISFLRSITTRRIKATLPAPALLGERMWDAEKSSKAYPTRDDFVRACVPVLRREAELIVEAGADIIQIDDPHLCLFVDPAVRTAHDDPDAAADFAIDTVNQVLDAIEGSHTIVHLCRRAGARARGEHQHEGSFEPIIGHLNRLRANGVTLEFAHAGTGDMAVLKQLREDLEIGLGCVSVNPGQIDSAETIVARVERALKVVGPERITLNPDCGFAPGSAAAVGIDEVYTKLRNQVAAARILRDRHG